MEEINTPNLKDVAPFNAYVTRSEPVGPGVAVRMLRDGSTGGRMQIVVVIDDYISPELFEKSWKALKFLLNDMNKHQGSNLDNLPDAEIYDVMKWRQENMSWEMLTVMLNYLAIAINYSTYIDKKRKLENPFDNKNYPSSEMYLLMASFSFGMKEEDFDAWIEQGNEFFMSGQWDLGITDKPFDKQQIRNRVRYFEDRVKVKKITLPKKESFVGDYDYMNIHEAKIYAMYHAGCFEKINEMLDKSGQEDWKRLKHSIQNCIEEKIYNFDNSKNPEIIKFCAIILKSKTARAQTPD